MQYVSLIRDCIEAFDVLHKLPPNVTETEHALHNYNGRDYRYADYDSKHHYRDEVSKPWSVSLQLFQRQDALARRRAKAKAEKEAREKAKKLAEVHSDETVEAGGEASQLLGKAEATCDSELVAPEEGSDLDGSATTGLEDGSRSALAGLIDG